MLKFKWETEFKQTEIGKVPREWEVQKIKEVGEIAGGTTPSTKKKEYWDGRIPWLTPKDLRDYGYVYISRGERNITEKAVKECSLKIFPEGTVLLTTRAPIGYVAIAKNQITTNQGFRNIVPHKIKSEYLYYYLKNVTDYLKSLAGGSTFGELTGTTLKEVLIPYPPPEEQSRIATVLSWFDDLIENKKRQNEILEKVAMAIFKSWFVDFEPFKDEEFVYSEELGKEIPKGWEVKPIGEVVDILYGKGLPESKRKNGSFPVVGSSGIVGYHAQFLATPPSIVIGRKGNAGSVYLMLEPFYPIDTVFYTGKTTPAKTFYIYHYLKLTPLAEIGMTDTAVPGININNLKAVKIPIPPQPILQHFHSLVEPLFQKIILNQKQIMVLRKIRDALLPKLVFGKLRVEVVE